jgi:Arc/MetJ-type ribon-helix-helix transcriptional regulator
MSMKVELTKELEAVLRKEVKSGLYKDAGEVIRNAIRQTYCPSEPDPHLDSLEIAEIIRHARKGKYRPHRTGDLDRLLQKVIARRK